jgi:hypothetical protein
MYPSRETDLFNAGECLHCTPWGPPQSGEPCTLCGDSFQRRVEDAPILAFNNLAEKRKREGIASTESHDQETNQAIRAVIGACAETFGEFDADAVIAALQQARVDYKPNQVGAAFNWAARTKLIEWTGRVRSATRPESHGRLIRIWRKA